MSQQGQAVFKLPEWLLSVSVLFLLWTTYTSGSTGLEDGESLTGRNHFFTFYPSVGFVADHPKEGLSFPQKGCLPVN